MTNRFWQLTIPCIVFWTLLFLTACNRQSPGDSPSPSVTAGTATVPSGPAAPLIPTVQDRNIARNVAVMLRSHFSGGNMDATHSNRALELYLKSLDPAKLYFLQSDVDAFKNRDLNLVEMTQKGDLTFAFEIYNRFLQRIEERIDIVLRDILTQNFDFAQDDEMVRDRKLLTYSQTQEEARDRWVKRVKYDLLLLKSEARDKAKKRAENNSTSSTNTDTNPPAAAQETKTATSSARPADDDPIARLKRRYTALRSRMRQSTNDEVIETYLSAVTNGLDPHTSYMSPSTFENFKTMMRLNLEGIGATLQSVDGYTTIKNLLPGGAADKDGRLRIEDRIIGVGQGKGGEVEDVVDMKLTDVVSKIRGPKGTIVRLEVLPDDGSEKKIIEIVREKVQLEDCQSAIFEAGAKPDGSPYKIGVIDLPSFYLDIDAVNRGDSNAKSTVKDVRVILKDFVAKNVDAVVLDLRLNGGGSLPEAVNLTGLFIETGPVVQVKGTADSRSLDDNDAGVEWTGPLTVLTSKFSASASEILAGAIKDYRRGLVIGDATTHGKGSVQTLIDLNEKLFGFSRSQGDLGALKMTIQMFYRPAGESTQIQGVDSDVELPSLTNHYEGISESDLEYPLPAGKIKPVKYPTFPYVPDDLVKYLRENSATRIENNEKFLKTIKEIDLYLELKKQPMQTLHEEKFFEERDRLNADKEEKDLEKKMFSHTIERDYYLDEVMAITIDAMRYLQRNGVSYPPEKAKSGGRSIFNLFGM